MAKTTEEIVADIIAASPTSKTPPEMLERMNRLIAAKPDSIRDLRIGILGYCAVWIEFAEENGFDRDTAMRIVAQELEGGAAAFIRKLYTEQGKEFSCARFAMVAYCMAEYSEWILKVPEIDKAAEQVRAEEIA